MTEAVNKPQNYTAEQTTQLVAGYQAGETVEQLAEKLGKSVRSIVAKLSREGVYVAKRATKTTSRVKKAELVELIAQQCGVPSEQFESLEKATHEVLEVLAHRLVLG